MKQGEAETPTTLEQSPNETDQGFSGYDLKTYSRSCGFTREIGGVTFEAVWRDKPRPHWRYKLQSGYVGQQGYASKPKMWADLEHAYHLRPDRWKNDWKEA